MAEAGLTAAGRRRVEQPGARHDGGQVQEGGFAEFLFPEGPKHRVVQEGEGRLFLQGRFIGRGDRHQLFFCGILDQLGFRDIYEQVDASDSDKIAQNTVFGVTGLFLYVPLLFLDLSNAEREELGALRERYRHLSVVAVNNGCKFGKATPLGIQQPVNEPAR